MNMNTWTVWYRYQDVVRLGAVQPIECPDCKTNLTPLLDENQEVDLWCIRENKSIPEDPYLWGNIRSVVSEWNVDGEFVE